MLYGVMDHHREITQLQSFTAPGLPDAMSARLCGWTFGPFAAPFAVWFPRHLAAGRVSDKCLARSRVDNTHAHWLIEPHSVTGRTVRCIQPVNEYAHSIGAQSNTPSIVFPEHNPEIGVATQLLAIG